MKSMRSHAFVSRVRAKVRVRVRAKIRVRLRVYHTVKTNIIYSSKIFSRENILEL